MENKKLKNFGMTPADMDRFLEAEIPEIQDILSREVQFVFQEVEHASYEDKREILMASLVTTTFSLAKEVAIRLIRQNNRKIFNDLIQFGVISKKDAYFTPPKRRPPPKI